MRILVIGGTNFIGPCVVRNLLAEGHEVVVYHRGKTESSLLNDVQHIRSSQAAMPVLEFPSQVKQVKLEIVIHSSRTDKLSLLEVP